jgi:hypothetical protein
MAIPETQLETWARQGAVAGSRDTYATVKGALEDGDYQGAPQIFLQGSYGNDTNIYAESDVDVVIRTDEFFYYDLSFLSDADKAAFLAAYPNSAPGSYSYEDFKDGVIAALRDRFGNAAVTPGKRAIAIAANGNRRSSDVIVAAQLKRFDTFPGTPHDGISFFTSTGERIDNFPKRHSSNCTSKHQDTNSWFKPTVRILKNARGCMVDRGLLASKAVAPSYFLEGLLYNVPSSEFGGDYQDTLVRAIQWLQGTDHTTLQCANELHWLVRNGNVTWPDTDFQSFMTGIVTLWNEWR